MALSLADTGRAVATALEEAHSREDVEQYAGLFGTGTVWITSSGVLFVGRDNLRRDADGELKPMSGRHRYTYVVVQTEDGWEIAAGQNTKVAEDA